MQHMFFLLPSDLSHRPSAAVQQQQHDHRGSNPASQDLAAPSSSLLPSLLPPGSLSLISLSLSFWPHAGELMPPAAVHLIPHPPRRGRAPPGPPGLSSRPATVAMERPNQNSASRLEPARNTAAMNLEFKPRRWTSSRVSYIASTPSPPPDPAPAAPPRLDLAGGRHRRARRHLHRGQPRQIGRAHV